jgi:hypothetical protein
MCVSETRRHKPGLGANRCVRRVLAPGRKAELWNELSVNGGDKSDHVAAQNQASGGVPSAMARALAR